MTANPTIASQSHLASHVSTDEYLLRQGIVKLLEIKDWISAFGISSNVGTRSTRVYIQVVRPQP